MGITETLLDIDSNKSRIPLRLTELFVGAGEGKEDGSGLFASFSSIYLQGSGNPSILVNIFMKRGLYVRASEIVCSILLRNLMKRENAAPSRLPENGSIDFVPYSLIDSLWSMIDTEISSPTCENNRRRILV